MRGGTNLIEGELTPFDPENPGPFTEAAGTRLVSVNPDGTATIRNGDGTLDTVHPGWFAFRADGSGAGDAHFTSSDNVSSGTGTLFRAEQAG